jgi:signal transduction histidine kinase
MRKLFLKVYLPLAICVFMTLVIAVIAMFRIIPAQISSHRESVESFRSILMDAGPIPKDSILFIADSMDLDVMVSPRMEIPQHAPPPEGFYNLPGLPWDYPWRVDVSGGARGGPAGTLRQSFWLVLLFLLVSEGLVLFVALLPMRKRLAKLEWATKELASGNLGIRLHVKEKGDLIDDLGGTFNRMAEDIKSLVESHQELLGIVAHELRTPMARFRLALELLKEDSGDQHLSKIQLMEADLVALDSLVTELLDYNKLRREREIERDPIDLSRLCREIAHAELWSREDVELNVSGGGSCIGDVALLGRALGNLVRNAVKFANSQVIVRISEQTDNTIEITVEDDGSGYDPKITDRLGEPFIKGRDSSGTGLGLAIATRIVKLHGGRISFGSSSGLGGARVTLELPSEGP